MDWWFIGMLSGTLLSAWLQPDWPIWPWATALGLINTLLLLLWRWNRQQKLRPSAQAWRGSLILLCGLLCGIQWAIINGKSAQSWKLPANDYRQTVRLELQVESIVEVNAFRWRFDARLLQGPNHWPAGDPRFRLEWYYPSGEPPRLGEIWQVNARLKPAVSSLNQASFNYQAYLLRQQISAIGYVLSGEPMAPPDAVLHKSRQRLYDFFVAQRGQLVNADILLALVLAERDWISGDTWQLLQHTGVAHLMAISGLHLTMVFAGTYWVARNALAVLWMLTMRWCLKRGPPLAGINVVSVALIIAWLAAFAYAALAGFAVATLRALLLISVFIMANFVARRVSPIRVLLRVVVMLVLLDPLAFLDAGFWLSVGAVAAIFAWNWRLPVSRGQGLSHQFYQLWRFEIMLTLLLLPLSLWFFAGFAWVAPLTNLLLVPLFSVIVLPMALLAVLLLPLSPTLSSVLLTVADGAITGAWPYLQAAQDIGWWSLPWPLLGTLMIASIIALYLPLKLKVRLVLAASFVGAGLLGWGRYTVWMAPDERLWLHMLDVGQGSALVVERAGRALLIDSGPGFGEQGSLAERTIVPFLRYRGLQPDWLVLTHDHRDHTGGAQALQQAYPSLQVLDNESRYWPCSWGQQWLWQGVNIQVLAPIPEPPSGLGLNANNRSCVLRLSYRGATVLLPGDIERLTEFRLVQRYGERLQSDVLLVPHHGSNTSTHGLFLAAVRPQFALISAGYLNAYNMPHPATLERLHGTANASNIAPPTEVYSTAEEGQVSLLWQPATEPHAIEQTQWRVFSYRQHLAPYWFNQLP